MSGSSGTRRSYYADAVMRRVLLWLAAGAAVGLIVVAATLYWLLSGDGTRLTLERQLSAWLAQPVRIGSARAVLLPRPGITLQRVSVGDPATVTLGQIELSTDLRPLFSRRLEDATVVISDSRLEMPLPLAPPRAAIGSANDAAAPASGLQLVSIRRFELDGVTIVSLGRELTVSAQSSLAGSRLAVDAFTAESDDVRVEARGAIDLQPTITASFEATSPLLDVDELLALVSAFIGQAAPGTEPTSESARLNLRVTAPKARGAGVELSNFEAVATAYAGDVTIDPMLFELFGGRHEGWLAAAFDGTPNIRIGSSVANIDVGQLAAFGGMPGSMAGRMSGTIRLGASGPDLATVLASARGVGDVTIVEGTIAKLELVRTVLAFLGGGDEGRPAGGRFDRLTANFGIAERRVTTEDLSLEAPDVDLLARGRLDLATKQLDGNANLVLSEALSARTNPTLYRYTRMGNRVVLPATISGTLSEPRVGIDAAAAARRGVVNEVERRLRQFFERVGPL
jgi:uncharacterized protein involved in outer membrane biogenesis